VDNEEGSNLLTRVKFCSSVKGTGLESEMLRGICRARKRWRAKRARAQSERLALGCRQQAADKWGEKNGEEGCSVKRNAPCWFGGSRGKTLAGAIPAYEVAKVGQTFKMGGR